MTQYANPLVISDAGPAASLERLSLAAAKGEGQFDESWLQGLLFANPQALPTAEIDYAYREIIPVCREMQTPAGPIDLLFITPDGGIAVVETKLWRNPEARREVVAQILDYAKELAQWDYEDLSREVAKASKGGAKTLFEIASAHRNDLEEREFVDSVTRNLRYGRFLLLIAGDGIREGVENLTGFLDRLGRLEFTFGLVELAFYRLPSGQLLAQPRVLAKTMIVRRSVVRIEQGAKVEFKEEGEEQEIEEEDKNPVAQFYLGFWTDFLKNRLTLDDKSQPMASPSRTTNIFFPQPPSGSQAWVSAYFSQSVKQVGVYLRFARGGFGEEAYRQLLAEKDAIDRELGLSVEWYTSAGKSSIGIQRGYTNLQDSKQIEEIRAFFAEVLNRFISVFRPRLERIAKEI